MTYSDMEKEVIVLNAACSMIDDMVNRALFLPLGAKVSETNLMPVSADTRRIFSILLVDFLSSISGKRGQEPPFGLQKQPKGSSSSDYTFLYYLRKVCENPQFNNSSVALSEPVRLFADWLEEKTSIKKVWFPSINVEVDLEVERKKWIKITGNIAKHNFSRLEQNVSDIVKLLKQHGHDVDRDMGYVILPEFQDWFYEHLLSFHTSSIAAFLNNIRWGVREYLSTEYQRSFHLTDPEPMCSYRVPDQLQKPLAINMYWSLMNSCGQKPLFPKFTVTPFLKGKY